MTVHSQLTKCLNSIESARADLEGFALETQNQEARQVYRQLAANLKVAASQLRERIDFLEREEPQFQS